MAESRINPEQLLIIGVAAIGVYVAYKVIQGVTVGAKAVAGAATAAGEAVYHGAQAITSPVSSGIASIITLFDAPGIGSVPGNVLFPDGTAAPLSSYRLKTTQPPDGNVYIIDRGSTWQLGQSDADGDWPATYVSG